MATRPSRDHQAPTIAALQTHQFDQNWTVEQLAADIARRTHRAIARSTLDRILRKKECLPRHFDSIAQYLVQVKGGAPAHG